MKKNLILSAAILLQSVAATAQFGGNWYDGQVIFNSENYGNDNYNFTAMNEGEELGFSITHEGLGKVFTVGASLDDNQLAMYGEGSTAKLVEKDGITAICIYDQKNNLKDVLQRTKTDNWETLNKERWMQQTKGLYKSSDGKGLTINLFPNVAETAIINGKTVDCNPIMFNSMVTRFVRFGNNGGALVGEWEIEATLDGITLHGLKETGSFFERDGRTMKFKESDPNVGRFFYANDILLIDRQFRQLDKPTLRIMRNAILARHGYKFQSKDLQEYFAAEPWYKPIDDNSKIKLTLTETLNLELIKAAEAEK